MQLDDIESFITTMYRLNLTQLVRLSELREEEGGLSYANVAEYNVRIRDDDRYRKIRVELEIIKEDGDGVGEAKHHLYHLLADRIDELSDDSIERIRRHGAGRRKVDRPRKGKVEKSDKSFLESMMIKGDTAWIKN